MHNRSTRLRAGRVALTLLLVGVVSLLCAGRAEATPWGTAGADYDGVLCRLGTTDVPMGAWTVNGTVPAFSTEDITGSGASQQPAPVSGSPATMVPGQAGFSPADIGAVAYLLAQHRGGTAAELAELGADVAIVAGSGQTQSRCLGQNGTSARRAATRLADARSYAGPYTVRVSAPAAVIPGANAELEVTVLAASGAAAPGLAVTVTAGGSVATVVTGNDGVARTSIVAPAAAATTVTASAAVPTGLVYLDTTPATVTLGPLTNVTGSTTLRPVLHPQPAVSVTAADLVLAGATVRPVSSVTGTFGYSGTGDVTLRGPVAAAGNEPCSSVPAAALDQGAVRWQDTFTFRGDAQYRSPPTPELAPGCYALRATVTTTNSSPPERGASAPARLTVATLKLTSAASAGVAAPGGLSASVTGTDPGGATVVTTVEARGPLPVGKATCTGDFAAAPVAGTSRPTTLRPAGARLRATIAVPAVRTAGCYALVARSEVTLDGRTLTTGGTDPATSTTAILRPGIVVATRDVSGEQGTPMPGTVQVSGTFGFPGVVAIGVVEGTTIPITGCRDAAFAADPVPATTTTKVRTSADDTYAFRTPAPAHNACYTVAATFTVTANAAVTATTGAPGDTTIFLAGVRPDRGTGSVVQTTESQGVARAVITYSLTALLMLAGAGALFVRTFARERGSDTGRPLFGWRPNRGDGSRDSATLLRRPMPGPR